MSRFNLYGDRAEASTGGYGVDIAAQRTDHLDRLAVRLASARCTRHALDLGCGSGAQAVRLSLAGMRVWALDRGDCSAPLAALCWRYGAAPVRFLRADLRDLPASLGEAAPFAVVTLQRAIHYLSATEAGALLAALRPLMAADARLFISASGLDSELGDGYPHRGRSVGERFAPLAAAMAARHHIVEPVCLYRPPELAQLLLDAGYGVERLFCSPFGNIKAVAGVPQGEIHT